MHRYARVSVCAATAAAILAIALAAGAQLEGGPGVTRLLVSEVRVKPAKAAEWRALQRDEVAPALEKAGVERYAVWETLVGDASEYVVVRPLPSFAEFNGPDPLDRALGAARAAMLKKKLADCICGGYLSSASDDDRYGTPTGSVGRSGS